MSLGSDILSDSRFTVVSNSVSLLRGLIVIPLITKLLGTSEYGIWTVLLTLVTVVKTVGGAHLHGALIRYQHDDEAAEQSYSDTVSLTFIIALSVSLLMIVAIWMFDVSQFFDNTSGEDLVTVLLLTTALMASEMIFHINWNFPRAKGNIKLHEGITVGKLGVETIVLILIFMSGGSIPEGIMGLVAVSIITNVGLFYYIISQYRLPTPRPSKFHTYLAFGLPMVPKDLSGYILQHADKYLLLYFLSPSAVGVYSVVYGLSSTLQRVSGILNPTLYPTISSAWDEGKLDEIQTVYGQIFKYYTILVVPALIGLTILADPLLRLISNDTIANQGVVLMPILALAFVLQGYETVVEYILTSAEETQKMAIATGIASTINIVLNVLLIPVIGLTGAALTTLFSQIVFTGLVYQYATTHISITLPWESLLQSIISAGIMGTILLFIPLSLSNTQTVILYPFLGVILYFASMFALGAVSADELRVVVHTIQP